MDGDGFIKELVGRINTVQSRNEIVEQIDILLNSIHKIDIDDLSEIAATIHSRLDTVEDKESYLMNIKKILLDLPVVELSIAITPSNRELKEIVFQVRNEISPNAIVNIEVDPYIIGGAKVSFQGNYFDGSIRSKLNL